MRDLGFLYLDVGFWLNAEVWMYVVVDVRTRMKGLDDGDNWPWLGKQVY